MATDLFWLHDLDAERLAIAARPRGGEWLSDELHAWRAAGVDLVVSTLTSGEDRDLELAEEASCCAVAGLEFVSFPMADRSVPGSMKDMAALCRRLNDTLNREQSVVAHCRMGIGRSSLIAASLLAVRGVDPNAAFERISEIRGFPVPDTQEQVRWVERFARRLPTFD